ncbi:MAG: family transporter [Alphaproteobacteria bacterium]|nr:family transporter [Alphaproteobacteria bacterium]
MAEPPPEIAKVPSADSPALSSLLSVVVGVVVVGALYFARTVLVPIMLAVLLAFILAPLVGIFRKLKLGRTPSVIVAVLLALGVIGAAGAIVGLQVAHLASNAPDYAGAIQKKLAAARASNIGQLPQTLDRLSRQFSGPQKRAPPAALQASRAARAPIPVEVHQPAVTPLEGLRLVVAPLLGPLETMVIVLVVAIFVLLQREDLRDRLIRLFGSRDLHRTTVAIDDAGARLSRYFLTQSAVNASFGTAIGAGLYFIGVPAPLLWGILAGLLRFVPYIGAFLAAVPPLLLAAAVDPGWTMAIYAALLFLIAEPFMGYVVEPNVYGHATGLSPVAVIVAAVFWTWLWGPIGLILSTPLTLCLVVLGRHVERLEFIDVLLGDRPALTPVEGFYQRMLAGDTDEVLEQAELLLKERALSSYYDAVAIPGLRLAIADRRRGVLSRARLAELGEAAEALVEELSGYDDQDPEPRSSEAPVEPVAATLAEKSLPKAPAPSGEPIAEDASFGSGGAVLCISGAGPVDAAVTAMLDQLLAKHGLAVERAEAVNGDAASIILLVHSQSARRSRRVRLQAEQLQRRFPCSRIAYGPTGEDRTSAQAADGGSDLPSFASLREAILLCHGMVQNEAVEPQAVADPALF